MRKNVRELLGLEVRAQSRCCCHRGRRTKPKRRGRVSAASVVDHETLQERVSARGTTAYLRWAWDAEAGFEGDSRRGTGPAGAEVERTRAI